MKTAAILLAVLLATSAHATSFRRKTALVDNVVAIDYSDIPGHRHSQVGLLDTKHPLLVKLDDYDVQRTAKYNPVVVDLSKVIPSNQAATPGGKSGKQAGGTGAIPDRSFAPSGRADKAEANNAQEVVVSHQGSTEAIFGPPPYRRSQSDAFRSAAESARTGSRTDAV
ncbi:hypothetical protein IWQ60_007682 [Tieghemiomyces parasiticus]|uniref:Uncharacterized protein n=1 Tax=Tieghemiomyces parasiticus TaxID=78921 RepID=A0A9W8A5F0_9FUNG|nr:hypothetical protein IWQ60_007682 [Tieghemiomyces parasiticus]